MLRFGPSRVGHMCCLDEAGEAELLASRIPLELCLTSNVATASVGSYAEHHITSFRAAGHPLALCTDDSGVFDTALSMEYAVAAEVFDLSREEVVRMAGKAIAYAALEAEEVTRAMLRSHFKAAAELLLKERQN